MWIEYEYCKKDIYIFFYSNKLPIVVYLTLAYKFYIGSSCNKIHTNLGIQTNAITDILVYFIETKHGEFGKTVEIDMSKLRKSTLRVNRFSGV